MLDFKIIRDAKTHQRFLETSISGKDLLTTPQLNKGTAFTRQERIEFGLLGKLPYRVETLDEQVNRAYLQYKTYQNALHQNIYLNNLHDKNQTIFYRLVSLHLNDMLPIIYTPIVGLAVKEFSREYRQPRGLYISYEDRHHLDKIFQNRSNPDIDLIVITDGEGVLGIGDQGIGGMDIPVAKSMVYSLCGGIDPTRTLPIFLDVGTNNQTLLNDPLYLGLQKPRIPREDYDKFIEQITHTIQKKFPNTFLHWEDFGRDNARRILDRYADQMCTFNDDIQGTGAVTLAALLAAADVTKQPLKNHRIVIFGAGTAGTGIADQIVDAMVQQGLNQQEAYQQFWLVDRQGLLIEHDPDLTTAQIPYARPAHEFANDKIPSLLETVEQVKPTILIGCSAQTGAFTQKIIEAMAAQCPRPIIFPLSNPDEKCEATPHDLLAWTHGQALIATGTAFPMTTYEHQTFHIAQCNNALVFPGIGLGILAVRAKRLSKKMIWSAAEALSKLSPSKTDHRLPLLPSINDAHEISKSIAKSVAEAALAEGLAQHHPDQELADLINSIFWEPQYLPFRKKI